MLTSIRNRALSLVAVFVLGAAGVVVPLSTLTAVADPTPPDLGTPTTVTSDALPTVQINGVVWSQVIVGNTVYVGGSFTSARPAGSAAGVNETPRTNLLAYNLQTGELITSFNLDINGQVLNLVVSPDGGTVYLSGDFTKINGFGRNRIAAFNATTGALLNWAPNADARVSGIAVINNIVYFGGLFNTVNGIPRTRLAAVDTAGAVLDWAPSADNRVMDMVATPTGDKVVIAGGFLNVNGNVVYGQAALDPVTGASVPWLANATIRNYGNTASIYSLSADSDTVYGTGFWFGGTGNYEGVFALNPADGSIKWLADCHGDTYSAFSMNNVVYAASHHHTCDNIPTGYPEQSPRVHHRGDAFTKVATGIVDANNQSGYGNFAGFPAPTLLHWYPDFNFGSYTGQDQGPWDMVGNGDYLVAGGEFTTVNGVAQQGLVRFAKTELAPNKDAVRVLGANFKPSASVVNGQVRINWTSNYDRDSEQLTYQLVRDGNAAAPVAEIVGRSSWWKRPLLSAYDLTAVAGATYSYRIWVRDAQGNLTKGDSLVYTVPALQPTTLYAQTIEQDVPANYWRLGEASGSAVADWMGNVAAAARGTYTRNVSGALAVDADKGASLSSLTGSTYRTGWITASTVGVAPQKFTVEAWVKTTTTRGGQILGFGTGTTAASLTNDRTVYMDDSGKLYFGVNSGGPVTINTAAAYNNGQWHHIAASLGADGMKLYVDGVLAAERADITSALQYNGYWHIGGDNLALWPGATTQDYFLGSVDEVAVYRSVLPAARIQLHQAIGATGQIPNNLPVASFTDSESGLGISLNGAGSTDSDGTIASYSWNFGDGQTGTGLSANHTYGAPGTYTVSLTVTDNLGGTNTVSKAVRFNAPPAASFAQSATFLNLAVDAAASVDSDGSITSYVWDFGDGSTATGIAASHLYALPGTYPVKLTVTDNDGVGSDLVQSITVAADPTVNLAPVASFTAASTGRTATFDGSASTDSDGTIVSYAWDFGDGTTATGSTTSHTYLADGSYLVTLTVTDDDGATHVASQSVAAAEVVLAKDTFGRTVNNGWGTANFGGNWTTSGTAADFSVADGVGKIKLPSVSASREVRLNTVASSATDIEATVSLDQAATGNGVYVSVIGRRVGTSGDYRVKLRFLSTGAVQANLVKVVAGVETTLKNVTVAGMTYVPGQKLTIRLQVSGVGTTDIKAKVWDSSQAEPAGWLSTTTDTTPVLQAQGAVALNMFMSSNATTLPMVISVDNIKALPIP